MRLASRQVFRVCAMPRPAYAGDQENLTLALNTAALSGVSLLSRPNQNWRHQLHTFALKNQNYFIILHSEKKTW